MAASKASAAVLAKAKKANPGMPAPKMAGGKGGVMTGAGSTLGRTATPGGGGKLTSVKGKPVSFGKKPPMTTQREGPKVVPGQPNVAGYKGQSDLAGKPQSVGSMVGTHRYGMIPKGKGPKAPKQAPISSSPPGGQLGSGTPSKKPSSAMPGLSKAMMRGKAAMAPGIMKKPGGMPPGMGMKKGPGMRMQPVAKKRTAGFGRRK